MTSPLATLAGAVAHLHLPVKIRGIPYTSRAITFIVAPSTAIEHYTAGTPNGLKISCMLEEVGRSYKTHKIDIAKNVQKDDWFLKINPNGRIPAIIDKTNGKDRRVFEGASIQLYLIVRYDPDHAISFPYDSDGHWEMVEWLVWMQSGIGPMQGQTNHFCRYAPKKIEYAINLNQTETKRLYSMLDDQLVAQEKAGLGTWIVGGKYTIADIARFSWVNWADWAGMDTESFSALHKWFETFQQRPAVERGVNVPDAFEMKEAMKTKEGETEYAKHHSNWVMQGMDEAREKHA